MVKVQRTVILNMPVRCTLAYIVTIFYKCLAALPLFYESRQLDIVGLRNWLDITLVYIKMNYVLASARDRSGNPFCPLRISNIGQKDCSG
jgi:hypothetical protein